MDSMTRECLSGKAGFLKRWAKRAGLIVAAVLITMLVLSLHRARKLPALEPWHEPLSGEFTRWKPGGDYSFEDYLELEDKLFVRLKEEIGNWEEQALMHPLHRFGWQDKARTGLGIDWNRTVELEPESPRGAAVLVHGLSDSPYSLRAVAEILVEMDCYVLCLRLPGHGTQPGGLLNAHWKDWQAALRLAVSHAREKAGSDVPLFLGGYSMGGALAVEYAATATGGEDRLEPDAVFLFSPALGVTPMAFMADWHRVLSWIPAFEKNRWQDIGFEYDPYKYNSFTKNSAYQIYRLTKEVEKALRVLEKKGRIGELPPLLSFQSTVDSTVSAPAVARLHARLRNPDSELVLFDTNQYSAVREFLRAGARAWDGVEGGAEWRSRRTLMTNRDPGSREVVAQTWRPGEAHPVAEETGLAWPPEVFSLSHVALPFRVDDPVYGDPGLVDERNVSVLTLGNLSLRGERGLFLVPMNTLMRLRHNPFFPYVEQRLRSEVSLRLDGDKLLEAQNGRAR